MFSLDIWPIVLLVFSLGGHTNTYRTVSVGGGAFELCLPSLGFLFTKLTLRCLLLGQACHMTKVGHGGGQPTPCNIMPCEPYRYILYSQFTVMHNAAVTMM